MKQIQIPEQLFMELVKFHLLDMEENLPSIKQGLEAKLDALLKDRKAGKIAGEYVKQNTGATKLILKEIC